MDKIEREKSTVKIMIALYCKKKEGNKTLCHECKSLTYYALARLDNCKFGNSKPTCKKCPIHCYKPEMRAKIKQVMSFSGPLMIFFHPIMALRHLLGR